MHEFLISKCILVSARYFFSEVVHDFRETLYKVDATVDGHLFPNLDLTNQTTQSMLFPNI